MVIPLVEKHHVRKTLVLDGTTGHGAVGDAIEVFTLVGRVKTSLTVYVVDALVTNIVSSLISFGTADKPTNAFNGPGLSVGGLDPVSGFINGSGTGISDFEPELSLVSYSAPAAISSPILMSIFDGDVSGTFIIDAWYDPITDDGAMVGDEASPGLAATIANAVLAFDFASVTGEASRSLLNAVRFLRNKWSITSGVLTVTKEDDTTAAWTGAVTTAAGDPVDGIDPA